MNGNVNNVPHNVVLVQICSNVFHAIWVFICILVNIQHVSNALHFAKIVKITTLVFRVNRGIIYSIINAMKTVINNRAFLRIKLQINVNYVPKIAFCVLVLVRVLNVLLVFIFLTNNAYYVSITALRVIIQEIV
jgi:hypothetical protein